MVAVKVQGNGGHVRQRGQHVGPEGGPHIVVLRVQAQGLAARSVVREKGTQDAQTPRFNACAVDFELQRPGVGESRGPLPAKVWPPHGRQRGQRL